MATNWWFFTGTIITLKSFIYDLSATCCFCLFSSCYRHRYAMPCHAVPYEYVRRVLSVENLLLKFLLYTSIRSKTTPPLYLCVDLINDGPCFDSSFIYNEQLYFSNVSSEDTNGKQKTSSRCQFSLESTTRDI
ncbi:uncharacterized protein LOC119634529 [Glossina fuscipes]|uniref:Uncharacterized protein LOC119634529 n=1 Tax=Glossina fuscipes TaxID=7396 RepID=A0A8U0WHK9_9MUSC|nr:uncharacterized protein LOC119634529 [Glossina fuscipes]